MKKTGKTQRIIIAALTLLPVAIWFAVFALTDRSDPDTLTGVIGYIPVMATLSLDLFTLFFSIFYLCNNGAATDMLHYALLVSSALQTLFVLPLGIDFALCGLGATEKFILTGWLIDGVGPQIVYQFTIPVAIVIFVLWMFVLGGRVSRKLKRM